MAEKTPLYPIHRDAGAKLVEFAGFMMPLHYGSQLDEHQVVREDAGMFDVSHMYVSDLHGEGALPMLRKIMTADPGRLEAGQAVYGCLCNRQGGVIDDAIAYRLNDVHFRLVSNAGTRAEVEAWLRDHLHDQVDWQPRNDVAMIAVQGPSAMARAATAVESLQRVIHGPDAEAIQALRRFRFAKASDTWVARTGYTGEDGVEIMLPAESAMDLWHALQAAGVKPCGLGARDTLRLEAGLSLYGQDLDRDHTPVESGLAWTVDVRDPDRDFNGRDILEEQKVTGTQQRLIGLELRGKGIMRAGQDVELAGQRVGRLTSGGFGPTLDRSIGLARVDREITGPCDVIIRGNPVPAQAVPLPFYKAGA